MKPQSAWRYKIFWWAVFAGATVALSQVLAASRGLTGAALGHPTGTVNLAPLLIWGGVLFLMLFILGYDSYLKSRAEGKVVHRVWLFEKLYQYRHRELSK